LCNTNEKLNLSLTILLKNRISDLYILDEFVDKNGNKIFYEKEVIHYFHYFINFLDNLKRQIKNKSL
jgi:hypothetical protein